MTTSGSAALQRMTGSRSIKGRLLQLKNFLAFTVLFAFDEAGKILGITMSPRLTTAIRIAKAAKAILHKTKSFPAPDFIENEDQSDHEHIGVEPMLLALSMELALKAWFVFDYNNPEVIRSHNLIKLFDGLKEESQKELEAEFKRLVAPQHPSIFYVDYSIRDILYQHQDAFVDWRYLHEANKTMMFDQSTFEATLEMVLHEFRKLYHEVEYRPMLPLG